MYASMHFIGQQSARCTSFPDFVVLELQEEGGLISIFLYTIEDVEQIERALLKVKEAIIAFTSSPKQTEMNDVDDESIFHEGPDAPAPTLDDEIPF